MLTVLITTSGTGSRLGEITQHTNKALVPVGSKLAICHIIDSYPEDTEFVITLGYKGHLVEEFCKLAYPETSFIFVRVDPYEGQGSSLLYSMNCAKEYLQKPFFFHCCDTILTEKISNLFSTNTLFVSKDYDTQTYSSVAVDDKRVTGMYGKGFTGNILCYTGVAFYKDYHAFWTSTSHLLKEDSNRQDWSDIHTIQQMLSKDYEFETHYLSEFYDTGNLNSYKRCQDYFKSPFDVLAKHNESICFLKDTVIKFNDDKEVNRKRTQRGYLLESLSPKIVGSTDHFLAMEFVKGTLLSDSSDSTDVTSLVEWAQEHLWSQQKKDKRFLQSCREFYLTKTFGRLKNLKLTLPEANEINGIQVPPIHEMINSLDQDILLTDTFSHFHGDFIFDNIIKTQDKGFVLLDWRHEFASELEYGDPSYDLAKLRHNLFFNHKNITNGLFQVEQEENKVTLDLKCNFHLVRQIKDLDAFLEKYNYSKKKIEILTAIIWLNMAPLYEGSLQTFLFYFGKLNLYFALSGARP